MKLQYASDLHIEFPENKKFLRNKPLKPQGDILVLAGDIVPLEHIGDHSDFFDYLSDHYSLTYWLPGNHEYYHSDMGEKSLQMNEKIRENILLVNNTSIRIGNTDLIFSTLWTRISSLYRFQIQMRYSDFHAIKNSGSLLSVDHYNSLHEKCLIFLEKELALEKSGKKIVITHHMPTFFNYPEEYKGDALNEAFAVELSGFIRDTGPDYWIFGHHHTNKGDFKIGETNLITNQLGYVMYFEHKSFNQGKTIEL